MGLSPWKIYSGPLQ